MLRLTRTKHHKEQKIKNRWRNNWREHIAYHLHDDDRYTDVLLKVFKDGTPPEISANQTFNIDQRTLDLLSNLISNK